MSTENINELDVLVEELFQDFLQEFEIDPEASLNDVFFDIFYAGFEEALEVLDVDEEEEEDDNDSFVEGSDEE